MATTMTETEKKNEDMLDAVFNSITCENVEDVINICTSVTVLLDNYKMIKLKNPKLIAVTFKYVFDAIIDELKSKITKEMNESVEINICDRLLFSCSTLLDEDNEIMGNYMIGIKALKCKKKDEISTDINEKVSEKITQWANQNVQKNSTSISNIAIAAKKALGSEGDKIVEFGVEMIPIFIFIKTVEMIITYIKKRRAELNEFEYEINFCNCFFIGTHLIADDDGVEDDDIYIRPNISEKLGLKDNAGASSKFD